MGGPERLLPAGLVLLMLISIITPFAKTVDTPDELEDETLFLGSARSSSAVDVPSLQIGDEWV